MRTRLLLLLIVIAWIPVAAQAQVSGPVHREWEFGIFGTAVSASERTVATPVTGVSGQTSRGVSLRLAKAAEMGFGIAQNLGRHWAANVEYSFSNQPLTFKNLADAVPTFQAGQAVHRMTYEILYLPRARNQRLRPYVFAGPGITLFHIHKKSKTAASALGMHLNDPWKPTFNWGGGVKFLFQDHLAVNVRFSDTISGLPRYGLPRTAAFWASQFHPGLDARGVMHSWRFGAGLIYEWD
jgi:opacity protein-like surface antigen